MSQTGSGNSRRAKSTTGGSAQLLTVDQLADMLRVSRQTIERAVSAGDIVPTSRTTSGRARFSIEQAEELSSRAEKSRQAGYKRVMKDVVLADGRPRTRGKGPPLSAE